MIIMVVLGTGFDDGWIGWFEMKQAHLWHI